MTISVAIITNKRELNHLLLDSLSFADETILVIDNFESTSSVILANAGRRSPKGEIHKNKKIKTYFHSLNSDFSSQRNFALQKAHSDWVLFIDDDEYVGTELAREIKEAIQRKQYSGYFIRRQDVVYHQPLLHGETGHLQLLRLGRRTSGKFQRPVHEFWKVTGRVGELESPLYHRKDHFVSEFIGRMDHYGKIDAQILATEDKPFSWFRLLFYPVAKFKRNYFFKAGFLDGTAGLFLAYLMGVQSLTVRIFQWENQK